jgi:putative two-component system response regulator
MSDHRGTVVLVVDDDEQARRMIGRILSRAGFVCTFAGTAAEARRALAAVTCPLVLCDVSMPGESGLDLMASMPHGPPDTAVVMASGQDDPVVAAVAVARGAYGYLVKPFTANELLITVDNALHRRRLELEARRSHELLEEQVLERTEELRAAMGEIARSRLEVVRRLSRAVEQRDMDTGTHIERIGDLSARLAERAGLPPERVETIRTAAPMHDVGKLGIPDAILTKPGPLTDDERAEMQRHARIGYEILSGSGIELLDTAATIAYTHHERWDGAGYPRGLHGADIPLEGRIVAVADVYDALSSDRVYRKAFSPARALELVAEGSGSQFDASIAQLLPGIVADHAENGVRRSAVVAASLA